MLLKDKYIPYTLNDSEFHRGIITSLERVSNMDCFHNLFLYGPSGSGKYSLVSMILCNMYGNDIHNKYYTKFRFMINGTEKEIDIFSSKYHYELYLSDNNNYDRQITIELLKKLSESPNILTNDYTVIVIKNAHYLTADIYDIIKMINEKRYNNCRFILLADSLVNTSRSLFGFFFFIRIPMIKPPELIKYFSKICSHEKLVITEEQILSVIQKNNSNLNLIFMELDLIGQKKKFFDYESQTEKKINGLIKLIDTEKIENISDIKRELYLITANNIDKIELIKYIFNYYIYKIQQKQKFTELTAEITAKVNNGYRELIHLEYYLVSILQFLRNNKNTLTVSTI
jgi:DNA polymerase III delta prime subunit